MSLLDQLKSYGDAAMAVPEIAGTLLTSGPAEVGALLNGLDARHRGLSDEQIVEEMNRSRNENTYYPRSKVGQQLLERLGMGLEKAGEPFTPVSAPIEDKLGLANTALATSLLGILQPGDAPHVPLKGLPKTYKVGKRAGTAGPNPVAREAAASYMQETGRPYTPPETYAEVKPARAEAIAANFEQMKHDPKNPAVKASYDAMIDETLQQWKTIEKTGLKVEFIKPGQKNPYEKSPRMAIEDVQKNNHLWVYPTDEGFGGSASSHVDVSGNPLLRMTDVEVDGKQLRANDVFRIVHDYFGHVKEGVGFRASGEENAWRSHAAMYSDLARPAMTTETRGQNSWVNYGQYGEKNRTASSADTQYAPQKIGLLYPEFSSSAPFPEFAREYPPIPEPELKKDLTTGKEFLGKGSSPETDAFMQARREAQKEIDSGNYEPYFNVDERFDVDPSHYPTAGNTLTDTLPKKQATIDKHKAAIDTPQGRADLLAAFKAGDESGGHDRWYAMGQLEHEFIDELGPEAGRAEFKRRFADAMAATTGGADPTSNLLMAHYGNYLDANGMQIPDASYKMPHPIGGRYVTGNMAQYGGLLDRGHIPVTQEKRHNFSADFTGHRDRGTIDEQMTGIITPGKNAPGQGQYGIYEGLLADVARGLGLESRDFQDVAWGGKKTLDTKGRYKGKPMIQHVNEMIERTHRLTGLPKKEIVRRGLIRAKSPLYAAAPAGLLAAYTLGGDDE